MVPGSEFRVSRKTQPETRNSKPRYTGRFAPSPTGPLHFGSLVAAVGSFLQARAQGGRWLVRMEDIDPPREVAGAGEQILRALEAYGLHWDGELCYQSRRSEAYLETLEQLRREGLLYPCTCSRKAILETARRQGLPPGVYPGTCRSGPSGQRRQSALRLITEGTEITFEDAVQGRFSQHLEHEVGDFVLRRADGLFAYQLAVVVDDAEQGITEVVRGSDLLDSTPRQIHLQRCLGLPTPGYLHLPVALNPAGEKLSKQTHAPALDLERPLPALFQALEFLGQQPPAELLEGDLEAFWRWTMEHWNPDAIPRGRGRPAPPFPASAEGG